MKKLLCVVVVISLMASAVFTMSMADTSMKEAALEILRGRGIVTGFDDGGLHEDATLTRAQFAQILCKAFPADMPEEMRSFDDLTEDHWAYESIQKAVDAGWLSGYDNGKFGPDDNITYEQAVNVVCRVVGYGTGGSYPQAALSKAIDYGLADGVDGLIGNEVNREQAARLILNALDYIDENRLEADSVSGANKSAQASMAPTSSAMGGGGGGGGSASGAMVRYDYEASDMYGKGYYGIYNTEEYTSEEENIFKDVITSPLSTFSIDTDTASYSNMRRFILNSQKIPAGSIRTEELINYFDYDGPEIEAGEVFGVSTEVGVCPWNTDNDLAMITVQGEELTEYSPSNLVFLIDTSGSMYSYNKLPYVKKALSMLLDNLSEKDTVSIVTYASGTGVALEPTPATQKDKILAVIEGLRAGGATAGESGINLAYAQAEKARVNGNNRIILCTDGDFNVGISSQGDLEKLIEAKRETGIFLSVLGFGMGNYKDSKMETLADKGNGNYAYIDNLREAKKVLVDDMSKTIYTIAKDVKIQVEFNPAKVKSYRLVGYENRILNAEDFENDAKDAGELGSGSTVTVFYELVPAEGNEKSEFRYLDVVTKESDELMTVKIRYKLPEGEESILREYPVADEISFEMSEDFKFAAAVAQLGMILNDSEYKGTSTLDSVIDLGRQGRGEDKFGLRSEFIQLVDLWRYTMK